MTHNADIVPLFSTGAALKDGGLFVAEKPGAAKKAGRKHGPLSLCDLAKTEGLKQVHVVDDRFANFYALTKGLKEAGATLHFGLKLTVCDDMAVKDEASLKNESKVVVWMNGDGSADYEAAINLYSLAATEGFYYVPRIDWKTLRAHWHSDLVMSLPFYSSFLARNLMSFASIVPDLPPGPLLVLQEVDQRMPYDEILTEAVERYVAATPSATLQRVKSVYYTTRQQARTQLTWASILDRGASWDKPRVDGFTSREFSWESYRELMGLGMAGNLSEQKEAA